MKLTCHMGYFELHFTFQRRKINVKGKELLQNEYQADHSWNFFLVCYLTPAYSEREFFCLQCILLLFRVKEQLLSKKSAFGNIC